MTGIKAETLRPRFEMALGRLLLIEALWQPALARGRRTRQEHCQMSQRAQRYTPSHSRSRTSLLAFLVRRRTGLGLECISGSRAFPSRLEPGKEKGAEGGSSDCPTPPTGEIRTTLSCIASDDARSLVSKRWARSLGCETRNFGNCRHRLSHSAFDGE